MTLSSLRELGVDLLEGGQFERALGTFAEAVRRQPADHRSRMLAARCYEQLGQFDLARQWLESDKESPQRHGNLLRARMLRSENSAN